MTPSQPSPILLRKMGEVTGGGGIGEIHGDGRGVRRQLCES